MKNMLQALRNTEHDKTIQEAIRAFYWSRHSKTRNARANFASKLESIKATMTNAQLTIFNSNLNLIR